MAGEGISSIIGNITKNAGKAALQGFTDKKSGTSVDYNGGSAKLSQDGPQPYSPTPMQNNGTNGSVQTNDSGNFLQLAKGNSDSQFKPIIDALSTVNKNIIALSQNKTLNSILDQNVRTNMLLENNYRILDQLKFGLKGSSGNVNTVDEAGKQHANVSNNNSSGGGLGSLLGSIGGGVLGLLGLEGAGGIATLAGIAGEVALGVITSPAGATILAATAIAVAGKYLDDKLMAHTHEQENALQADKDFVKKTLGDPMNGQAETRGAKGQYERQPDGTLRWVDTSKENLRKQALHDRIAQDIYDAENNDIEKSRINAENNLHKGMLGLDRNTANSNFQQPSHPASHYGMPKGTQQVYQQQRPVLAGMIPHQVRQVYQQQRPEAMEVLHSEQNQLVQERAQQLRQNMAINAQTLIFKADRIEFQGNVLNGSSGGPGGTGFNGQSTEFSPNGTGRGNAGGYNRGRASGRNNSNVKLDGSSLDRASQLIASKEGFISNAKWDMNHMRLGYGSDTITDADGKVHEVHAGDHVTKEDAMRDLKRRTAEFQKGIVRDVGADAWNKLNPDTQAALTSVAYNYGSITGKGGHLQRIVDAIKTGDKNKIAQAVESYSGDNNGINAGRRRSEADIIRNSKDGPNPGTTTIGGNSEDSTKATDDLVKQSAERLQQYGVGDKEQCTQLAKAMVKSQDPVTTWRRGVNVLQATNIAKGTPIATFQNRIGQISNRYDDGGVGKSGAGTTHAALFDHYITDPKTGERTGIDVVDQWRSSRTGIYQPPHHHTINLNGGFGEKDAANYYAVNDQNGNYLGEENNPQWQAEHNVNRGAKMNDLSEKTAPHNLHYYKHAPDKNIMTHARHEGKDTSKSHKDSIDTRDVPSVSPKHGSWSEYFDLPHNAVVGRGHFS